MFPNKCEKNFKRKLLKNSFYNTLYLEFDNCYTDYNYKVLYKYIRANIMPLMVTPPFGLRVDNHNLVRLLAVTALRCPPLTVRPALRCPPLGEAVRRVRPDRLALVPQAAFLLQEGGGEGGLLRRYRFTAFLTAAAQPGVHFILRLSLSAKQQCCEFMKYWCGSGSADPYP